MSEGTLVGKTVAHYHVLSELGRGGMGVVYKAEHVAVPIQQFQVENMADDSAPKSAFELAMERLRKKDAEEGVTTRRLTDEEKAAIAEVRSLYDSKIAEQEILHQAAMRQLWGADPAEIAEVDRRFRREKERLASERDTKVEKIRRGEG